MHSSPARLLWRASGWLLALLLSACAAPSAPVATTAPTPSADLVISGCTIYAAPGTAPLAAHTIVVRDGVIAELRPSAGGDAALSAARHIKAEGQTCSAGFWNAHVHFTDPAFASDPQPLLTAMLLRYGFTQVVDTGSELTQTLALRDAIRQGALAGPEIVLANGSFVYTDGTPSYLPGIRLPEVATAAEAGPMVRAVLAAGADGIKLFAGSFMTPQRTVHLPANIIAAITAAAHQRNAFVMAHPTTLLGLENAVRGGVNVIAHTTAPERTVPGELLRQMRQQNTALIPTLKLWRFEMEKFNQSKAQADFMEEAAVAQLQQLHSAGVTVLFGTDVGYMSDFDPGAEYQLMQRAGMDWPAIHQALTTAPARAFGRFTRSAHAEGTLRIGSPANLVVLAGDPTQAIAALAQVSFTIINGQVAYARPQR